MATGHEAVLSQNGHIVCHSTRLIQGGLVDQSQSLFYFVPQETTVKLARLELVAQLDDLCIYDWLFVSYQQRDWVQPG